MNGFAPMAGCLATRLKQDKALLAPGVYDALSAFLVEEAGFEACYLSGASLAYTQIGRPDLGFVSANQVADTVARIRDRVGIPIIVDADTGFGNALNVQHTVRNFERAGAAAIQLEDQVMPKRCGHLAGKELVSTMEMAGKVAAAADARQNESTMIIARTDGVAVEGLDPALDRAEAYLEAGADVLFIEAPQSLDQMEQISTRFSGRVPLLANMVEGGRTPLRSAADLEKAGFKLIIMPGALVRAFAGMAQEFLKSLKDHGATRHYDGPMLDFSALNNLIGLERDLEDGVRFAGKRPKAAE